jgi:HK97 gp10 family phage protein
VKWVSFEVSCDVDDIRRFQAAMQKLDSGLQNQVYRCLASWAADVKAEAMRTVPVKTGYLRSTIYAQVQNWVVNFGADAAYAYFVEFGTKRMAARPYLWPAIQRYLPQLEELIREAIVAAKAEAGFQ